MTIAQRMINRSGLREIPSRYQFVPFQGGLDQARAPLEVPMGYLRESQNFEIGVEGMYQRVIGYERFDGRPRPSEQSYFIVNVTLTGTVTVGDTITGVSSSNTGKVIAIADDASYLVLTRVSGDFIDGESIQVSAVTVGSTSSPSLSNAAATMKLGSQYLGMAADDYRADIGAVPGEGPVRGVWRLKGDLFAVRDNVGQTEAVIHKATSGGWAAVTLDRVLAFSGGGTYEIEEGDTITGATSSATATVDRVILESGSWSGGDAEGRLLLSSQTGTFQSENINVGASTNVASITGDSTAVTILPGGTYRTVRYNFFGGATTERIYGCDSVNPGFEFDGSVYIPIHTGLPVDAPTHVAAHKFHLFFAFGAQLQHSSIGEPYEWSPITGAAALGVGDTITGLNVEYGYEQGGTLGVYSRNTIHMLYGAGASSWQLVQYREEIGAYADSIQNVGMTLTVDDRGLTSLRTSDQFGNFSHSTLSRLIQPWIIARKNTVTGSCIVRDKNQYRVFFGDKSALFVTMDGNKVRGMMPQLLDHAVTCIESAETPEGTEEIYFGSDDGFVYQMDRGTSFDGGSISAFLITHFIHFRSPRLIKRWLSASIELQGIGYAEFDFAYELGYNTAELHQPGGTTHEAEFMAARWDAMTWDAFYWDGVSISPKDVRLSSASENISFIIRIDSALYNPLKFSGINTRFTPRRYLR